MKANTDSVTLHAADVNVHRAIVNIGADSENIHVKVVIIHSDKVKVTQDIADIRQDNVNIRVACFSIKPEKTLFLADLLGTRPNSGKKHFFTVSKFPLDGNEPLYVCIVNRAYVLRTDGRVNNKNKYK